MGIQQLQRIPTKCTSAVKTALSITLGTEALIATLADINPDFMNFEIRKYEESNCIYW